ncbi:MULTISPECIES: tyrosine-type recombinase/integrase [Pseudomonas putida group]|uniref:tyrosine-type recombinase/integrase n=1 Tax=Pseudomonas putida group TaxID=136845 RepID=UPI00214D9064|nr:tyrosine-type recombinase/integrase [Pseudomonas aeruginosa]
MTKKSNAFRNREKTQNTSSIHDDDYIGDELEQDSLADEIEAELDDSRGELEEEFNEAFGDTYHTPALSLRSRLAAGGGDFAMVEGNTYLSHVWTFPRTAGSANNVHFNSASEEFNTLKRALIFYSVKDYCPTGRIRSYSTAKLAGFEHRKLEQYIFLDNHLTASPQDIKLISMPLIQTILEKARNDPARSMFIKICKMLRHWILLSDNKLIPEELCLEVTISEFYTPELRQEIMGRMFSGSLSSWIPYSEEDLEILTEYSLFWIESAGPKLAKLRNGLIESGYSERADGIINSFKRLPEFEALTDIEINGTLVMKTHVRKYKKDEKPAFGYSWIKQYSLALDHIRNAVFVLVALITGARRSELATLKFSDLTQAANGEYWLRILRTKTSDNPTIGDEDHLPIPQFVGDAIRQLETLRDVGPFKKGGWIFQSNAPHNSIKRATPEIIIPIIAALRKALPIDRLHCHRFRKTIAEILINRDERNIDIIRALFGHRSYSMTLQYISRNPLMVRTVALAIEQNYTRSFHEIVAGIKYGGHSGEAAKRIRAQMEERPEAFTGKQLKVSLMSYISHLLASGEKIFVRRTAVGTFCLSGESYSSENVPPCLVGRPVANDNYMPDASNCQPDCKKVVVIESAKQALIDNITFYSTLLDASRGKLSPVAERELNRRIAATRMHLNNIVATGRAENNLIEVTHV